MKPEKKNIFLKSREALRSLATRRISMTCDAIPYAFENVPLKKVINWLKVETSLLVKPDRPWGWPTHLQVEPTNRCNLRCVLCPVSGEMQRSQGHMDISLFRNLIDQIGDFLFLILLWDWGEPFMNPRIHEMIAYAKRKGIKLISSTNGHLFTNLELADRVIESGLDTLIFAVDGVSQATYEKYRKQGCLETALEGVRTLVARKRELGSSTPLINFRFIVMRHNEHEISSLKELAKSLGVDALTLKTLNPSANNTYRGKEEPPAKHGLELLPENHRYRRFDFAGNGDTPIHASSNPCKNLWNAPAIHWDGKVCPCTYDYDDRFVLGDLKKEAFEEVWRGRSYRRMRRMLRQNDKANHFCNKCSYAYKGGSCIDETIAEASFFVHT